jgi:hypothetical protein
MPPYQSNTTFTEISVINIKNHHPSLKSQHHCINYIKGPKWNLHQVYRKPASACKNTSSPQENPSELRRKQHLSIELTTTHNNYFTFR